MGVLPSSIGSMITRLEVDGFKNLNGFSCDFGPYTCIAGPNSVGKSNVFDAISFLSATASLSLTDAAARVRGDKGDINDIFGTGKDAIRFAVEMLVPAQIEDDLQRVIKIDHTYLRYELEICKHEVPVAAAARVTTLGLAAESLDFLSKKHGYEAAPWAFRNPIFAGSLEMKVKRNGIIETAEEGERAEITIRTGERGHPSKLVLGSAPVGNSAVSVYNRYEYPYVAAVNAELRRWMTLSLEPSAMRAPSEAMDPDRVSETGGNLPKTLSRLSAGGTDEDVLEGLVDSVRSLVDIHGVELDFDEGRQLFTLRARVGNSPMLPARSLSDGTLRFIALSILQMDPEFEGVICFEEPENGIHPVKMTEMFRLLRDLTVDPSHPIGGDNPLQQVIVNTHSPSFMYQHAGHLEDLMLAFADPLTGDLRLAPVRVENSWRPRRDGDAAPELIREMFDETFPEIDFSQWTLSVEGKK